MVALCIGFHIPSLNYVRDEGIKLLSSACQLANRIKVLLRFSSISSYPRHCQIFTTWHAKYLYWFPCANQSACSLGHTWTLDLRLNRCASLSLRRFHIARLFSGRGRSLRRSHACYMVHSIIARNSWPLPSLPSEQPVAAGHIYILGVYHLTCLLLF